MVDLHPEEEDAAAFAKHFDDQISTYANNGDGQVVAISLAEKQGREKVSKWNGKNLPLTLFQQFLQLMGRYCSYLIPRQDDGTSQITVNGRFIPFGCVTLY